MTATDKATRVQMPADPALHPAHVVAIRPDIDGARVQRGAYVLSVETPKGARNVVAPADGRVEIHVTLMQEIQPNAALFSISPTVANEAAPQAAETPSAETAPSAAGARDGSERHKRTWLQSLFPLACIGLAVIWPGVVFLALGDAAPSLLSALIAAALVVALLVPVWLLDRVPALGGRSARGVMAFGALGAFLIALLAGVLSPQLKSMQESAIAPVFTPLMAQISSATSRLPWSKSHEKWKPDLLAVLNVRAKALSESENPAQRAKHILIGGKEPRDDKEFARLLMKERVSLSHETATIRPEHYWRLAADSNRQLEHVQSGARCTADKRAKLPLTNLRAGSLLDRNAESIGKEVSCNFVGLVTGDGGQSALLIYSIHMTRKFKSGDKDAKSIATYEQRLILKGRIQNAIKYKDAKFEKGGRHKVAGGAGPEFHPVVFSVSGTNAEAGRRENAFSIRGIVEGWDVSAWITFPEFAKAVAEKELTAAWLAAATGVRQKATGGSRKAPTPDPDDEYAACVRRPIATRIPACSKIIESRRVRGRPISSQDLALVYRRRGVAYFSKRVYDRAISDLSESIKRDPKRIANYSHRGKAYARIGQYDRAIADFTQVIALVPNHSFAYRRRGDAHSAKRDYGRAIADYSKSIKQRSKNAEAYAGRGAAYFKTDAYDNAIADFDKAIQLKPKSAQLYAKRGLIYRRKREHDRAFADFEKAIQLNPEYATAYRDRGLTYSDFFYDDRAKIDLAIADYNKAIELNPKDAIAYNNRGAAYTWKQNYKRAIADYDMAIRLDPDYAMAYANRGAAYEKVGQEDRAAADRKMYRRLLAGAPKANRSR